MDQISIELCQTLINEKIKVYQNNFENDNFALKARLEHALSQLLLDDFNGIAILRNEYNNDLELVKTTFLTKISDLEAEIEYLNERHLSQNLMLEDNILYVQKLELEIKNLKNI